MPLRPAHSCSLGCLVVSRRRLTRLDAALADPTRIEIKLHDKKTGFQVCAYLMKIITARIAAICIDVISQLVWLIASDELTHVRICTGISDVHGDART